MKTRLLVAAERREFDGIRRHLARTTAITGLGVRFACEGTRGEERWVMVANGPGRGLASQAVSDGLLRYLDRKDAGQDNLIGMISTGYCGALDPTLRVGDIVVSDETHLSSHRAFTRGGVTTQDRVAVTAAEKRTLLEQTSAIAVDMEAASVEQRAKELGVAYACVRVVSDAAAEDMPLDFNRYRSADGSFSRGRIALAAMARPFFVMPALLEFDRRSKQASLVLGDFLADCRF